MVAITPQGSRARLRVERCFAGHVYVVTTPVTLSSWPNRLRMNGELSSRRWLSSAAAENLTGWHRDVSSRHRE